MPTYIRPAIIAVKKGNPKGIQSFDDLHAALFVALLRSRVPRGADALGEPRLRHVLQSSMNYYNETRTHLSLEKDAPLSQTVERVGVFFAVQSSANCITNVSRFDLRQAQPEIAERDAFP